MKTKINIKNIVAYFQGTWRYKIYYSYLRWLLLSPIIEDQISWRIKIMEKECYNEGSCKLCGCQTPALQMANKSCDKPCYPPFMSGIKWRKFIAGKKVWIKSGKKEDSWQLGINAGTDPIENDLPTTVMYNVWKNGDVVHTKIIKYIHYDKLEK